MFRGSSVSYVHIYKIKKSILHLWLKHDLKRTNIWATRDVLFPVNVHLQNEHIMQVIGLEMYANVFLWLNRCKIHPADTYISIKTKQTSQLDNYKNDIICLWFNSFFALTYVHGILCLYVYKYIIIYIFHNCMCILLCSCSTLVIRKHKHNWRVCWFTYTYMCYLVSWINMSRFNERMSTNNLVVYIVYLGH